MFWVEAFAHSAAEAAFASKDEREGCVQVVPKNSPLELVFGSKLKLDAFEIVSFC